jgi:DNA mismatch repair ATPase MutS
MTEQKPNPVDSIREINQLMVQSLMSAQQRNMQFAQSTFTNAIEVLRSHVEATRALIEQLEQQDAFQKLTSVMGGTRLMEPSLDVLRRTLSSYQQALEAAEKNTRQGIEGFEKAVENFEQTALRPPPGAH